ncbi:hypothetical protein OC844_007555, partial [Tilletia horrida]
DENVLLTPHRSSATPMTNAQSFHMSHSSSEPLPHNFQDPHNHQDFAPIGQYSNPFSTPHRSSAVTPSNGQSFQMSHASTEPPPHRHLFDISNLDYFGNTQFNDMLDGVQMMGQGLVVQDGPALSILTTRDFVSASKTSSIDFNPTLTFTLPECPAPTSPNVSNSVAPRPKSRPSEPVGGDGDTSTETLVDRPPTKKHKPIKQLSPRDGNYTLTSEPPVVDFDICFLVELFVKQDGIMEIQLLQTITKAANHGEDAKQRASAQGVNEYFAEFSAAEVVTTLSQWVHFDDGIKKGRRGLHNRNFISVADSEKPYYGEKQPPRLYTPLPNSPALN